jgi:predicted transcriptional regulator of viral defense system
MLSPIDIQRQIGRDIFDYQQLLLCLRDFEKPRDKISRLLAQQNIIRVKKGLYVFGEPFRRRPVCRELLANLIYGPSCVSLDTALSYHGLIPERVEAVTSVTTNRTRAFETPFGMFVYRQTTDTRYCRGITLCSSGDDSFLIATPEKALIDKVWSDKRLEGTRARDFALYLTQDLRIDPARLAALDFDLLTGIARAYDSRKINALLRSISNFREPHHA